MEENKVIEFSETLTVEDLQKANYYNFKKQKKYLFNQIIFIAMAVLMIGMSIAQKQWIFLGVGVVILIFSTVLFVPFYKKLIYRAVGKSFKEDLKIKLSFDSEGFTYVLEEDTDAEYPKYNYDQVMKIFDLKEYIYLYFNNSSIAIVKKQDCGELEVLEVLLKEKYNNDNKYVIDGKTVQ